MYETVSGSNVVCNDDKRNAIASFDSLEMKETLPPFISWG